MTNQFRTSGGGAASSGGQRRTQFVWGAGVSFEAIHQAVSEAWRQGDNACGSVAGTRQLAASDSHRGYEYYDTRES